MGVEKDKNNNESKVKITIEKDGETEVFNCNEYWLFVMDENGEDSEFQHEFRG